MSESFLRRLEAFGSLPDQDKVLVRELTRRVELMTPETDIIREGDNPKDVNLVVNGFAYRHKLLGNGIRQIVGFLMPGDICDLHVFILDAMDHSITTLAETQVVKIPRHDILALLDRPAISRALLMVTLVNEATSRDWLTNIGGRPAEQRMAHFLCEWNLRLRVVGLTSQNVCAFPVTQAHMAEALGISPVHVNRTLQALRDRGLILLRSRRLTIPDVERMWDFSDFRSNYLHMEGSGSTD